MDECKMRVEITAVRSLIATWIHHVFWQVCRQGERGTAKGKGTAQGKGLGSGEEAVRVARVLPASLRCLRCGKSVGPVAVDLPLQRINGRGENSTGANSTGANGCVSRLARFESGNTVVRLDEESSS